jgi:cytochrome c peroxidase
LIFLFSKNPCNKLLPKLTSFKKFNRPMKRVFFLIAVAFILHGCKKDELQGVPAAIENAEFDNVIVDNSKLILPESDHLDSIPQDPLNPLTNEKVILGKLLFHETRLGGNPRVNEGIYTYSCASCHHAEAGFQSGLAQGIGEGGSGFGLVGETRTPSATYPLDAVDVQPIRTPTVMNTAYQQVMLWNGSMGATGVNANTQYAWTAGTPLEANFLGYQGLETLGITGIKKHRFFVDTPWLSSNAIYKDLFDQAFSDLAPENRISDITVALAIAAYERTILPNQSPFQRWLRGDKKALTADEKAGKTLFFGIAKCSRCHNGPALNSIAFYALGMNDLKEGVNGVIRAQPNADENKGRGGFTQKKGDLFKFKVPQLYNLKDVKFFGHGASFTSVEQVVRYMNNAVPENPSVPVSKLPKVFTPLGLTDIQIAQIVKFVEDGLYDPNLTRYVPDHVPSGNCIPNNDPQSKIDRGCQ